MGEEYGESSPFLYFISHSDEAVIEAVRKGRKEEFREFGLQAEPPDPQSPETYLRSKIKWEDRYTGRHSTILEFYRTLIGLRKSNPALSDPGGEVKTGYMEKEKVVFMERGKSAFIIFDFSREARTVRAELPRGEWVKILDSAETRWEGPGSNLPARAASRVELRLSGLSLALYAEKRTILG